MSRVLDSALAPDLKFTAVVLASFADDDGYRIWPAIPYVAHLRGVSERAVQFHLKELRTMEILEIVLPATQWHPTHYRIVFDKLPTRPPFKPPDRQQTFLGPPGMESGVKPASPPPGVKYSAPGVKPTSPDPSRDPSLHTCTDARARETRNEEEETPASLPLIVAPTRHPDHAACAWCGLVCVPKFLHKQFKRALGGPVSKRAIRLRAFYADTMAAARPPLEPNPVKFWRPAFAARFSSQPAVAPPPRLTWRELDEARTIRNRVHGRCPHYPRCSTEETCIRAIARDRKEAAS